MGIIEGTTAEYVFIMYGERFPLVDAWRADQVLYGNYTLDIYSDDVGLCEVHRETPIQQLSKYNSTGYIYPTVHLTKCSISLYVRRHKPNYKRNSSIYTKQTIQH